MNVTEVLERLKAAQQNPSGDPITKAWTTSTGLVNYDLERPAIALYPWGETMTPLRNLTPRVKSSEGDTATHWKAITAIDTTLMPPGVSQGQRGGVISTTTVDRTATYKGLGLEDSVTFEAEYAGEGFDDVRARAVEGLLRATMMSEENVIFGGNAGVALGTTPTPTGTGAATGGALSDGTYYVACVALTHDGWRRSSVANGVVQQIVRTNADGTTDTINAGAAQKSAASSGTALAAGTAVQRVTANVTAVRGAVAYAWYLGTSATVMYLQQITTINSVNFSTALVTTTQTYASLASADRSVNSSVFSGYLYQTGFDSTSGAYYVALPTGTDGTGTVLTTDSAGGITQINTALMAFWDNYKLSPDTIWMSAQEAVNINAKVIAGGGAPLFRFTMDANSTNVNITAGATVANYLNKVTNTTLKLRIHPNCPPGTMLFTSSSIPYPLSGVGAVARMKARREYYQIEWPLRTRKYEFGVYVDEVLQVYALFAFGVMTNIANG